MAPCADVSDLCRQLADIPGTDLAGLLAALATDPAVPDPAANQAAADQALRDLINQAQTLAAPSETALALPGANPAPPEPDPAAPA